MSNASRLSPKRRSRLACKQCRQSKVKCGMDSTPCSRCRREGLDCEWNPAYRRTKNADRFSALEQQIETLKQADGVGLTPRVPEETVSVLIHRPEDTDSGYRALDIVLTESKASDLMTNYFFKYAVHVPFIAQICQPKQCHNKCELLFWTIISIGARDMQPEKGFLSRLSPFLMSSINQVVSDAVLRQLHLGHVQALLLLALWPPCNSTFWGDRCFTLAHLALITALNIGLHNPGFDQEYDNRQILIDENERAERMRTWAACLAVAQNLSMDFGILVSLPFDNWKISELVQSPGPSSELADDLYHYLLIEHAGYEALSCLPARASKTYTDSQMLSGLEQAEQSLLALQDRFQDTKMTFLNRLRMSSLMLHMQSMYFQLEAPVGTPGILRSYATATKLLTMAIEGDGRDEVMSFSPRTTLRMLLHASCVIFTVQHSSCRHAIEPALGRLLSGAAQMCFKEQAVQWENGKDLPHRCVDVLRGLWQMCDGNTTMLAAGPELAIKTRMGASVVYHCLAIFFHRLQYYRQLNRQNTETERQGSAEVLADFLGLDGDFAIPESIADLLSEEIFDTYDLL